MNNLLFYKYRAEQIYIYYCFKAISAEIEGIAFMESNDIEWKHKEFLEELMNVCFDLVYFDLDENDKFTYFIPEQPIKLVLSPSLYMKGKLIDGGLEINSLVWQPLLIANYIMECYREEENGYSSRRISYGS
ncbi:hypothetical protein [Lysinibacillus sphaericus]|uniref:hypothetical protein n=1 Tax=Lysinibacillus sphaericus TaxID=1421 RepID=UPI000C1828E8|nr:hypothetical protein [Lysinibacillus sphaericus]PIJ95840.1 hypothetical protein CTN02_22015 [Lysinibacillus sphaericus]